MSVAKKVIGVILAAGDSSRFGQNKLLQNWHGIPLIRHIALQALNSKLDEVVVVTGFETSKVNNTLNGLDLTHLENPHWSEGQSTSIKTALQHISSKTKGVCFLLGDQPFVTSEVINSLIEAFQKTSRSIVAPYFGSTRTSPTIFGRETFSALSKIEGDSGGRQLMDRFGLEKVQIKDEELMIDLDTLDDFYKAQGK